MRKVSVVEAGEEIWFEIDENRNFQVYLEATGALVVKARWENKPALLESEPGISVAILRMKEAV